MNYDTNKNPVEVAGSVTDKQDRSKTNNDKEKEIVQNKENFKKKTETVKKEYKKYDESSEMYPDLGRQIVEVIVLFIFVMMAMFFFNNIDMIIGKGYGF